MEFFDHTRKIYNPPAPKVPRRDSLGVEATGQICQTGPASAGGGGHFRQSRPPKSARDVSNLHILQMGAKSGQPGPKLDLTRANFADSMRHAENLHFYCHFQRFLALIGVRARPCCPHWACLGPNLASKRAQAEPCWAPVGLKLEPTGPSSAQVTPNLDPSGLLFGPT